MNESDATQYLSSNTYYFKIKSFAKSFEYNESKKRYINVDFAYLVELSRLDKELREYIIKLSLDTEHFLKVKLINDVTNNDKENGYDIVRCFLNMYPNIKDNIEAKKNNSACADLIHKYENEWAVWNIVEVLTFGEFIKLFELYYKTFPEKKSKTINNLLWPLKFIRNAAAHNNCLLNTLRRPYEHTHLLNKKNGQIEVNKELIALIIKASNASKEARRRNLKNPVIHDFIAILFLFDEVCTIKETKRNSFSTIKNILENRFLKHKEYFINDNVFVSNYVFVKKMVDYLYEKSI